MVTKRSRVKASKLGEEGWWVLAGAEGAGRPGGGGEAESAVSQLWVGVENTCLYIRGRQPTLIRLVTSREWEKM